jgi:hypothetical protein
MGHSGLFAKKRAPHYIDIAIEKKSGPPNATEPDLLGKRWS